MTFTSLKTTTANKAKFDLANPEGVELDCWAELLLRERLADVEKPSALSKKRSVKGHGVE